MTCKKLSIFEKGPKFAPTPSYIPHKDIVAKIEAAIARLPDESKHIVRTTTATLLDRSKLSQHKNTTTAERKALRQLKKDTTRVVMKADKGNCFVVTDRTDYDEKMESLLSDKDTYEEIPRSPFRRIEREFNTNLLKLKKQQKLDDTTYRKLY